MTASFLGPQIDHCACEVKRVSDERCEAEADSHHAGLDVVVVEILVHPQEEEFVLCERVDCAERGPENEGVGPDGEAALE